jgi:hypothetical protein
LELGSDFDEFPAAHRAGRARRLVTVLGFVLHVWSSSEVIRVDHIRVKSQELG